MTKMDSQLSEIIRTERLKDKQKLRIFLYSDEQDEGKKRLIFVSSTMKCVFNAILQNILYDPIHLRTECLFFTLVAKKGLVENWYSI